MNRFLLILPVICITSSISVNGQWKKIAAKDLSGWEVLNGTAPFKIEKGVVTGSTKIGSPNSFLCTKEKYSDFILEFDTWFDPQINSGVQIRSESRPDYQAGRVHGYQIELDPSTRAWSGGIYDEARRGWLYNLENNPAGKKALKPGEWNHYRIEAIGNSIRTWVNGIPCADLIDDVTASGFIALQVHSIGDDKTKEGLLVKWKNIRIVTKDIDKHKTPYTAAIPQISYLNNVLTDREITDGWKLLFDGKSGAGWMNARTKKFPETGWVVEDGNLTMSPETKKAGGGGDIVSETKYKSFELIFDFKYTKGANSGVKYFIDIERNNGSLAGIGCEYQVLDDRNHPDAKAGINGNRTLASLYDLMPPKNKVDNGIDKWNRATIVVDGNKVQHWLNGQLCLEYIRGSEEWNKAVASSKFNTTAGFGVVEASRILIQDHGDKVYFRNIKIREIK